MVTQLATVLCFLGIGYLFWVDRKQGSQVSNAVWIPLLWMFFAGSRFASQWLDLGPPQAMGAEAYDDGSPIDRIVFLTLILAGTWALLRRKLNWRELLTANTWILLFFLFAVLSSLWSDDPWLAAKRWVKGFGSLVMALILLTERYPSVALGYVLRRLAYVLLPLSILFIKYYPELGRAYHMGIPMFTGVSFQKNALGQLCLLLSVYFSWVLLFSRSEASAAGIRAPTTIHILIAPMLLWLLYMSQSATSVALTILAISFFLVVRLPYFAKEPRRVFTVGLILAGGFFLCDELFHLKDSLIRLLGREPDLTGRAAIWAMVLEMAPHPLIGAGYESFWSGDRLVEIWARMGEDAGGIIQAHNGYIEVYLNLGIIGLVLLALGIVSGVFKARRKLSTEYSFAVLRLAFIVIAVVYNYTEAAYTPLNNVFVLLLFSILEPGKVRRTPQPSSRMNVGQSA